jgi:thiamine-phosphate pyrophosphorylase
MLLIRDVRSRVCYVTPSQDPPSLTLRALVAAVLRAGVGMVQYRRAQLPARDSVQELAALLNLTRAARVPLIVTGRVDVALAVGADGVHLGPEDIPVAHARRMMGPSAIIGAEASSPADARLAQQDGATYIVVGPIFAPPAASPASTFGLDGLRSIRAGTGLPVCAAGGITPERIQEAANSGADLVAVISAINGHPDPGEAARAVVQMAASFRWPSVAP